MYRKISDFSEQTIEIEDNEEMTKFICTPLQNYAETLKVINKCEAGK